MNKPTQTPTPSPSTGLDPQKMRNDLEGMLKQAAPAQKQGNAPAAKPDSK